MYNLEFSMEQSLKHLLINRPSKHFGLPKNLFKNALAKHFVITVRGGIFERIQAI